MDGMTKPSPTSISLIGVPLDLGAKNLGVDMGPNAFRYAGIADKLTRAGFEVRDEGTIAVTDRSRLDPIDPRLRYAAEIVRVSNESAKLAERAIREHRLLAGLGGDHSITLGLVAGASEATDGDLGLIYLDAHGDMNTRDTTLSGNVHGMHLASLIGFGAPELTQVHTSKTKIDKSNLLHIGGSDFDPAELELIEREQLGIFTLFDLLKSGLAPLLKQIDDLAARVSNIYVSLDLDVIDRIYAPGAGMPNAKGLTYREIATIAEYIGRQCHVIGVDVVEYNPLQDNHGKTAELGIELVAKFFGHDYSWYTNYMARNQID
jgi:arginase